MIDKEGYEYLRHTLFKDTENSYWMHYFKVDFENTVQRKIQKNEYKYLEENAY